MASPELERLVDRLRDMERAEKVGDEEIAAFLGALRPSTSGTRFREVKKRLRERDFDGAITTLKATASFPRIELAIGVAFLAVGVFLFVRSAADVDEATRSAGWPVTDGTIVASRVHVSSTPATPGSRDHPTGYAATTTYRAEVEYTYVAEGTSQRGSRVSFESQGDRRTAERTVAKYPPGRRVRVHYDPAATDRSVIEAGLRESTDIGMVGGWFFLLLGLAWIVGSYALYRRNNA